MTERWESLGGGLTDEDGAPGLVRAVAVHGDKVYVGGIFALAGGVPVNNVAVWDASTEEWAALGASHATVRTIYADLATPDDHIAALRQFRECVPVPTE